MLVFCEDCGKKHSVKEGGDEHGRLKFRCESCGFLITAISVPPKKRQASNPDASVELSSSYSELDLGCAHGDDAPEKTLFLFAKDGRKVELEPTVLPEVKGNISVEQISSNLFKIRVVPTEKMGADLLNGYDGPGLEFFDGISGVLHTVPVVFSRIKPSFLLKPELVDLGKVGADLLVEGSFFIENCISAPLAVSVNPDPNCFSFTSFFTLISDTSLILAGGEERRISFSVRLSEGGDSAGQLDQVVLVTASDNNERPAQRVHIVATLDEDHLSP